MPLARSVQRMLDLRLVKFLHIIPLLLSKGYIDHNEAAIGTLGAHGGVT